MRLQAKWNFSFKGHTYRGGEVFEMDELDPKLENEVIVLGSTFEEKVENKITKVVKKVKRK
jgi:hypothetical protein